MSQDRMYDLGTIELFYRESLPVDIREAIDTTADNLLGWYECDPMDLRHAVDHITSQHGYKESFALCVAFCYRIAHAAGVSETLIRSRTTHFAFEIIDGESDSIVNPDQYASVSEMLAFHMVIAICNADLESFVSLFETAIATEANKPGIDSLLWTLTMLTSEISANSHLE